MNIIEFEKTLPEPITPLANYISLVQAGDIIYTSGALPFRDGVLPFTGKLGDGLVTIDNAQESARICILNLFSSLKAHLGSLDKIKKIIKITVFVASMPDFVDQPLVANGASDYIVEIFGDNGKHARSAVGVASLPKNAPVEIEMLIQI